MKPGPVRNRLARALGAATVLAMLAVLTAGTAASPALADVACTGDLCVVSNVVDTPAGSVTVTVTPSNVVTVALTPLRATFMIGLPFATPPGPPCSGCITYARTSLTTAGGVIDIDTVVIPPGPPGRFALPNIVVVSIHPPGPCRVKTVGTTVTFTPIAPPVGGP